MCNIKKKILNASLLFIPKTGFTQTTLSHSLSLLNLSPASSRLITRGPIELVENVLQNSYKKTYSNLLEKEPQKNAFKKNLKISLRNYINEICLYSNFWDQAIFLLSKPENLQNSYSKLMKFSGNLNYLANCEENVEIGVF